MEGSKPHLTSFLQEELHEGLALVLHAVVEYGILQGLLQLAYLSRGLEAEELHDLVAVDAGLEAVSDTHLPLPTKRIV